MRKNKFMRAASGLLVAVLLTTCVISGTFAKYVAEKTGGDSARVAKFGVNIEANGTMFAKEYAKDNQQAEIETNSVISSDDKNVVAPGTKGELANAIITGTPEVAVNVKYEPTLTISDKWKAKANDSDTESVYFPIVFKVGSATYGLSGVKDSTGTEVTNKSNSIDELKTAVENAIKAYSKDYKPNTDLSKIGTEGYVHVSWEWAFDKNDDVKDTYLGDQAAKGNAATVELSIKTTVTQID